MEEDRISELGDEILLHILCSINIKEAVQTCILSKRWRNLWTSMPDLNFNFRSMAIQKGVDAPFESESLMTSFTNFVSHFLSRRDHTSTIRTFQLSAGSQEICTDSESVEEWMDYAINHGVQHLDLDFLIGYYTLFKLPSALFGCETLQELRVKQPGYGFVIPKLLILPNLKSLFLEQFTFKYDDEDDYNCRKYLVKMAKNFKRKGLRKIESCVIHNFLKTQFDPHYSAKCIESFGFPG